MNTTLCFLVTLMTLINFSRGDAVTQYGQSGKYPLCRLMAASCIFLYFEENLSRLISKRGRVVFKVNWFKNVKYERISFC